MIDEHLIKDSLQRSGYLLECRIAEWLGHNNYIVYTNDSFPDPLTGKTREIDIFADEMYGGGNPKLKVVYSNQLVIEAINNPVPITFFQNKGYGLADTILVKLKYVYTVNSDDAKDFLDHIDIDNFHHLKDGIFSTQYCSFQEKKGKKKEWVAFHPEDLYQTFLKLYYCVKYITKTFKASLENNYTRLFIYQPLLILQGDLYRVDVNGQDFELKKVDYVQFDFSQYYENEPDSVVVDVITEKYLPAYVSMIRNEEKVIGEQMINFYYKGHNHGTPSI